MRISCEQTDQGFHPDIESFRVTWNNNPVFGVIAADEELGLVHYIADENGHFIRRTLRGVIKIERLN